MKLSPKINLGCKSCNKNNVDDLNFDINDGSFGLKPIEKKHKVTTLIPSKTKNINNKVKSLF